VYADLAYARAVHDAGAASVSLAPQPDVDPLLDQLDALVLPGGDDLLPDDPSRYPSDVFDPTPGAKLDFDGQLLAGALERGLPVLGICYGMQLIALRGGGRLLYHLPADAPGADDHRLPEDTGRHPLEVLPGTRLAQILGEAAAPVNSLHHQCVETPGAGMRVCARSPDGLTEAIESDGPGFLVGVQWHPEKLEGKARLALFRALARAASEVASEAASER
jgi:putative glutamine amidotransferase